MSNINFYYKNVTAAVVGAEHGIGPKQFDELADQTKPIIAQLNEQRKAGKTMYRELPYNEDYPAQVKAVAD